MLTSNLSRRQEHSFRPDWTSSPTTAALLVLLTILLRIWHIQHGLPDFLEEAIPFKKALQMWGWESGHTDLNPHFFNYPTLSLYLHLFVQKLHYGFGLLTRQFTVPADYWLQYQIDPTAHVVLARLVGVACDVCSVLGVWWIGERLCRGVGVLAALLVALAPTMLETARSIYSDSVMAALAVWALALLLAYLQHGGRRRLATGIVLIGLAAGAKYTAGLLVLPLAWAMWMRHGRRGLLWWPAAAAASCAVFLISSPYVVLDFPAFWHDFSFERMHMAKGHLGILERHGAEFQLRTLTHDLGWPALTCLIVAGVLTIRRRRERIAVAVALLWWVLLPQALSVALFRAEAARYLLALLPAIALLAAWGALSLVSEVSAGRRRQAATVVLVALLILPAAWSGLRAALLGRISTQQLARYWCEEQLSAADIIVQEPYGATLRSIFAIQRIRSNSFFPVADEELRERFLAAPLYHAVSLPLTVSGQFRVTVRSRVGDPVELTVFEHATELNQVFYAPALFHGVDYFVTSGGVRQRYEKNAARYQRQIRFYRLLDSYAVVAAHFRTGGTTYGPEMKIYRLDERFQEMLAQTAPTLDVYWWARAVPQAFRIQMDELLVASDKGSGGAIRRSDGRPAHWVLSLEEPFDGYILPFLFQMTHHLTETERYAAGRRLAAAMLAMRPDLELACMMYSMCATEMGDWDQARRAVMNSLKLLTQWGRSSPQLRFELVRILTYLGETEAAREELELLLQTAPPHSEIATAASRLLAGLAPDGMAVQP